MLANTEVSWVWGRFARTTVSTYHNRRLAKSASQVMKFESRCSKLCRERGKHVLENVLDVARARLVLLLESRFAVELLPIHLRDVEDLVQLGDVLLREETLPNLFFLFHPYR